eukprot:13147677-Alexandrium_andersonii.AAC.1
MARTSRLGPGTDVFALAFIRFSSWRPMSFGFAFNSAASQSLAPPSPAVRIRGLALAPASFCAHAARGLACLRRAGVPQRLQRCRRLEGRKRVGAHCPLLCGPAFCAS